MMLSLLFSVEKELEEANEKLAGFATMSKELARVQREIREIHRRQSIQNLLKPSPVIPQRPSNSALSLSAVSPQLATLHSVQNNAEKPRISNKSSNISHPLVTISERLALEIFSYVEANDVLSFSMTCHTMNKRILSLFGIGKTISASIQATTTPPKLAIIPPKPIITPPKSSSSNTTVSRVFKKGKSFSISSGADRAQVGWCNLYLTKLDAS